MLAYALRHEADILRNIRRPEEAEPLYLEAEKIYRQQGEENTVDLANTLRGLALVKEMLGELDVSQALWREARALYQKRGAMERVAECHRKLSP